VVTSLALRMLALEDRTRRLMVLTLLAFAGLC
jgi:hypothetical protein